ncbi:MAG: S9 family peptidase [Planctomycetota bacterium]|nr:S9 family peptidase [Planctomycetota bacterium]
MKNHRLSILIGLTSLLIPSLPALGQENDAPNVALRAEIALMAKIGSCSSPTFSPDGRTIAFISTLSGLPQIWTVSIPTSISGGGGGGWPTQVTAFEDPVGGIAWSPTSNRIAFSMAPGGGMNSQTYLVNSDGSRVRLLTDGGSTNNWLGDWTDDGRHLTIASNRRTPGAMDAWLITPGRNIKDDGVAEYTLISENPGIGYLQSVSADNRTGLVYRLASRGDNDLYLIDLDTKEETLLTPHEGPGSFSGTITADGSEVYLVTNKDRDLAAFGVIVIDEDGNPGDIEILAQRDDAELGGFVLSHSDTVACLVWNVAGRNEIELIGLTRHARKQLPDPPGEIVGGVTFSPDDTLLAMSISGSTQPTDVWLYDVATNEYRQITRSPHAGVDLRDLVKPELITFRAHDGLELSGWLYLPHDFEKPGPVVLSFHGGPEGQERPRFRDVYQALLKRGIAVFAPNVRGSSGFGKAFVNLDNGALRVDGVRDIESCLDVMFERGIGDYTKMGIMGGSYGGYMTMAGLTEFPDRFAAGANLFGLVNFQTFFANTEPWMAAISKVEYGDPDTEAEMLYALSPFHKMDRVIAPTIVLHGANDTNCPVVEAEQVVDSLKERGVPVKYVLFEDEGHGWRKTKNKITSTVSIVEWFEKYLK